MAENKFGLVMFDFLGWNELLVVVVVFLVLFGPKKLPEVARTFLKGVKDVKKTVNDIKDEIDITKDIK